MPATDWITEVAATDALDTVTRSNKLTSHLYVSVSYVETVGMVRFPSVRQPVSFFDVFTVTAVSIAAVALVLAVWHGSFVRIEMGVFTVIVFGWVVWAVNRILKESVQESRGTRQRDSRR